MVQIDYAGILTSGPMTGKKFFRSMFFASLNETVEIVNLFQKSRDGLEIKTVEGTTYKIAEFIITEEERSADR